MVFLEIRFDLRGRFTDMFMQQHFDNKNCHISRATKDFINLIVDASKEN